MQATPRNSVLGFLSDLAAASYSPERTQQKLAEIKAQMEADLVILREKAKLGLSMSERQ